MQTLRFQCPCQASLHVGFRDLGPMVGHSEYYVSSCGCCFPTAPDLSLMSRSCCVGIPSGPIQATILWIALLQLFRLPSPRNIVLHRSLFTGRLKIRCSCYCLLLCLDLAPPWGGCRYWGSPLQAHSNLEVVSSDSECFSLWCLERNKSSERCAQARHVQGASASGQSTRERRWVAAAPTGHMLRVCRSGHARLAQSSISMERTAAAYHPSKLLPDSACLGLHHW